MVLIGGELAIANNDTHVILIFSYWIKNFIND